MRRRGAGAWLGTLAISGWAISGWAISLWAMCVVAIGPGASGVRAQAPDVARPPSMPPARASLRYYLTQRDAHGTGAYSGWRDMTVSVGDYTLEGGAVHAHYVWQYGSDDDDDRGTVDRDVSFDPATRLYVGRTDLDEWDESVEPLATWLWIPPGVGTGEQLRILDETFEVVERAEVQVTGTTLQAIHLRAETRGERHDAYGDFDTQSVDDYWFDAATGMFLREARRETDVGTYAGNEAGFQRNVEVEVVDASYAPAVGAVPPAPRLTIGRTSTTGDAGNRMALVFGVSILGIGLLVRMFSRRGTGGRHTITTRSGVEVTRFTSATLAPEVSALSPHLGPFLGVMADVARAAGNDVWIARDGGLAGLAIDDVDAKLVAVYARNGDVAEALRTASLRDELIAEVRYPALASVARALAATGQSTAALGTYAYNLYETIDVLERRGPLEALDYDATLVRRMQPSDVAEAAALMARVYGAPSERFLAACLEAGDVAFVAHEDGQLFGVALATVVGLEARLHTLTVDPDARSRGVGKELYRARLRALADLGVERVVTEVSRDNPAAMEVARQFGMTKVGEMYVQSARAERADLGPMSRAR